MTDITEEELKELEYRTTTFPGIVDPDTLLRLIDGIRHWRHQASERELDALHWMKEHNGVIDQWGGWLAHAEDERDAALEVLASLKDESTLRDERDAYRERASCLVCTAMIEERDAYRNKLAQVIAMHGRSRPKKRRR